MARRNLPPTVPSDTLESECNPLISKHIDDYKLPATQINPPLDHIGFGPAIFGFGASHIGYPCTILSIADAQVSLRAPWWNFLHSAPDLLSSRSRDRTTGALSAFWMARLFQLDLICCLHPTLESPETLPFVPGPWSMSFPWYYSGHAVGSQRPKGRSSHVT